MSTQSRLRATPLLWLLLLILAAISSSVFAAVPVPVVIGPLASDPPGSPGRNYPFAATDLVLARRGYVEQEFFFQGTANVYDTPNQIGGIGLGPAAPTANIVSAGHPYKTRMIVRRPENAAKFNGTVIVEWQNVTSGYELSPLWQRTHEFFLREGYAWIGVSAQNNGVGAAPNGLRNWSPGRYGTLDVTAGGTITGDRLSYDIFAQGIQAARSVPTVLGGLAVQRVIAAGVSQSAGRLAIYINAVNPRDPIIDAGLLEAGGQQIRTDLDIPVMKVLSESEYDGGGGGNQVCSTSVPPPPCQTSLQPDTDLIRVWGMAGTSHADWVNSIVLYAINRRDLPSVALFDNCPQHPTRPRIQGHYIMAAAIDGIVKWLTQGVPPPHADPIQIESTSPRVIVARDAFGNALGGVRIASLEVPIARNQGTGSCGLPGLHVPFDTATLQSLYPTHGAYVNAIVAAAEKNVADRFLLPADAQELIADASRASLVGTGLICGPLCANVSQFLLNPSTSILRDQTREYHFVGGDQLLALLDQATHWVAQGYTAAAGGESTSQQLMARQRFARGMEFVRAYVTRVQAMQKRGFIAPETASLLVDFGNILIARLEPLS
jgi:hypothetical protein